MTTTMQAKRRPGDTHHRVEPCNICGDVGFPEVIATCSRCNIVREHVYCMRVYLKEVCEDWLCESCQSGNDMVSPICGGNKNFPRGFGLGASDTINHDILHTTSPSKVNQDSGWQAPSKRQKLITGKVKFIPQEEVVRLHSGNFTPRPVTANSWTRLTRKTSVGTKNVIPRVPSLTVKPNAHIVPSESGLDKLTKNSAGHKNSMINQQGTCSLSKAPIKEHICVNPQVMDEVMPIKEVGTCNLQMEKRSKDAPYAALQTKQSSPIAALGGKYHALGECNKYLKERDLQCIQTNIKLYRAYLPSLCATWRGGFKFLQTAVITEFYDGLEALPPCTVHSKAYRFSCEMPKVLQVEPLPASSLLADLFQNDCPDLQDVALYFFPSDKNERSRGSLISIFEFMDSKNSMLRSCIDGVELLIFTSKQLTVDSQGTIARVNTENFLWGLFRCVKNDKTIEILPDTGTVDMDIDMVGGNEVLGRIDHVLKDKPRNLSISSWEATPFQGTVKMVEEKIEMNIQDMDIDMVGGNEVLGRIDHFLKDRPRSFSISSWEATPFQGTAKIVEKKIEMNIQDKVTLPAELRKKIKTEFSSDVSMWNSVMMHSLAMDKLDVPPGFEARARDKSLQAETKEEKNLVNGAVKVPPCKSTLVDGRVYLACRVSEH